MYEDTTISVMKRVFLKSDTQTKLNNNYSYTATQTKVPLVMMPEPYTLKYCRLHFIGILHMKQNEKPLLTNFTLFN